MDKCTICDRPARHVITLKVEPQAQHPLGFCSDHARDMVDELGVLSRLWKLNYAIDPPLPLDAPSQSDYNMA